MLCTGGMPCRHPSSRGMGETLTVLGADPLVPPRCAASRRAAPHRHLSRACDSSRGRPLHATRRRHDRLRRPHRRRISARPRWRTRRARETGSAPTQNPTKQAAEGPKATSICLRARGAGRLAPDHANPRNRSAGQAGCRCTRFCGVAPHFRASRYAPSSFSPSLDHEKRSTASSRAAPASSERSSSSFSSRLTAFTNWGGVSARRK